MSSKRGEYWGDKEKAISVILGNVDVGITLEIYHHEDVRVIKNAC